jgi:Peptidase family M50
VSATPILDLEQPLPAASKRGLHRLLGFAGGLALAAIPILADQCLLFAWNWPALHPLLLIPTLFVAVAVHEGGHLLAAYLMGLHIGGIAIGPFLLARSGRHWVWEFQRHRLGGYFKPLSSQAPIRRFQYVVMILGGPVSNLALAVVAGVWFARYGSGMWQWRGTLFWTSLFLGLLSSVPFSSGLLKSDGARLLQLFLHPEEAQVFSALIEIQTLEVQGVRPREWSAQLLDQLAAAKPSATEYLACRLLTYYRLLDEGRDEAALLPLEDALARSAKADQVLRRELLLEAACVCARIQHQPHRARVWRDRALPLLHGQRDALYPVDASIAMCEGRYQEATKLWQSARARLLQRRLDSGLARFALAQWTEWENLCREKSGAEQTTTSG